MYVLLPLTQHGDYFDHDFGVPGEERQQYNTESLPSYVQQLLPQGEAPTDIQEVEAPCQLRHVDVYDMRNDAQSVGKAGLHKKPHRPLTSTLAHMKNFDRVAFTVLFLATLVSVLFTVSWMCIGDPVWVKWLSTAGLLATVAGVVQLEVGGLFDKIMAEYGDEEKYPYGPPSRITREIIDNPDTPIRTWLRNMLFFRLRTGFWLIVMGTLIQVGAVWA